MGYIPRKDIPMWILMPYDLYQVYDGFKGMTTLIQKEYAIKMLNKWVCKKRVFEIEN